MGPPENMVPGVAALELLLVKIERHAVWLGEAYAFPSGVRLTVELHGRDPAPPGLESGVGTWRFGFQFADGRKAITYGPAGLQRHVTGGVGTVSASTRGIAAGVRGTPGSQAPAGPLLQPQGGGGSRTRWRQGYWLWPLPPAGDLLIAFEWPNAGIELTTATIEAGVVRDAAARAQELWPAPDLPE